MVAKVSSSPRETATAANSMATNSSPLPKNTVAKNRSSNRPMRLRSTAMNQRNAIPVKGTKFSAMPTQFR